MKSGIFSCMASVVVVLASMQPLSAQTADTWCGDQCKVNSNLAFVINVPLNPTAQVATVGWGGVGGVGYNFNKRNAIIAEFMWNRTYPAGDSLQPLRTALQASNLNAYGDYYVLTGNYRFDCVGNRSGHISSVAADCMSATLISRSRSQSWARRRLVHSPGSGGASTALPDL
jgi:hypothetical protein